MLRLRTLGALELSDADIQLLPRRRKELTLLAFLSRQAPQPADRSELAALLWDGRSEARARQSLRQALTDLRRVLPDQLEVTQSDVRVDGALLTTDVAEFEQAVAENRFDDAVALWQGDLLPGTEEIGGEDYCAWLDAERAGLRRQLAGVCERLVDRAEESGNWQKAIACAEWWCAQLPADERAHLKLAASLELTGRPAAAAEVKARFRSFATGERELTSPPRNPSGISAPDFVGREEALSALATEWRDACRGEARIAVVAGAAGTGKTRLLDEFARFARLRTTDAVITRSGPGRAAAAIGATGGAVPILVLVDAAGAADPATQRLIQDLLRQPRRHTLLIIADSAEALEEAPFAAALEARRIARRVTLEALTAEEVLRLLRSAMPMSPAGLQVLARRLCAESAGNPGRIAATLSLLVGEGLLAPGAGGRWELTRGLPVGPLPLPDDARERTRGRLERATAHARRIAAAAATLGGAQPAGRLRAVSGLTGAAFTVAMNEVLARRFLRESARAPGHYEFFSEDVRRCVRELSAPRRNWAFGRWRRRSAAVATLAIAVAGAAWVYGTPSRELDAVAVFPFEIRGGDSLGYLREGMPELLGIGLEGTGALIRVGTRGAVAGGAEPLDPAEARVIARRLGAERFVLGRVIGDSGSVSLEATLHDVDRKSQPTLAMSQGRPSDILRLVDSLGARLAAGAGFGGRRSSTGVASRTSGSAPALRAFLAGVRELRAARMSEGVEHFRNAVALDTTFALAWHQLSRAADGSLSSVEARAAADRAARFSASLPERDRLLIAAHRSFAYGAYDEARAQYGSRLALAPTDPEARLGLAEAAFHSAWRRGASFVTTDTLVRAALAVDAASPAAQSLHVQVLLRRGFRALADSTLRRYIAESADSSAQSRQRELRAVVFENRGAEDAVRAGLAGRSTAALLEMALHATRLTADPEIVEHVIRPLIDTARTDGAPTLGHLLLAHLATARGRAGEAASHLESAARLSPATARLHRTALALSAPIPPGEADLRAIAERLAEAESMAPAEGASTIEGAGSEPQIRAYLLARLACTIDGCRGAHAAAQRLGARGFPSPARGLDANLARSLEARLALFAADTAAAIRQLHAAWDSVDLMAGMLSPFYSRPDDRLLLGDLLAATGDTAAAIGWYATLGEHSPYDLIHATRAQRRQATLVAAQRPDAPRPPHGDQAAAPAARLARQEGS